MQDHTTLNPVWWTDREAPVASRSFDGLTLAQHIEQKYNEAMMYQYANAIAAGFNIKPQDLGLVSAATVPWATADEPPEGESTQPLSPLAQRLDQVLTEEKSKCWATNALFDVFKTDLGTFHLYIGGMWLYCASNIEDDLQGELQRRYNEKLRLDYARYSNELYAIMYDVTRPLWHEMEPPKND